MSTSIETLNHWAQNALAFAWPMLWQSSLLIAIVFALDVLSARKVRPAIRHALWMIVLVKLLLPPTLALPTGAAWWLWPAKPALTPVFKNETVTFDTSPLPENPAMPLVAITTPPPKLDTESWIMLVSGAISAGLLCWLAFKWLSVGRNARKAGTAPEFEKPLDEARQLAGLRGPVRLRLIDDEQSPAVYGFFRPVILLPRALAERLSGKQLRAVLLHEAIHVRRGDVWVNCAQTLLQIAYWWHPLLWLANARIRRLREEAVDDAVMLAMRDEADAYAPTLLEVARFAFRRPLASLGLVGILESRSALRQRIERLVDFRPPRRAGVTLFSLCGIFAFSAVALPMGQAPVSTTDSVLANTQLPAASMATPQVTVLIEGQFFWMPPGDFEKVTVGLPYNIGHPDQRKADAEQFSEIKQRIRALNLKPFLRPRILTRSGIEADLLIGDPTNGADFDCTPVVANGYIDLSFKTDASPVSSIGQTNRIKLFGHAATINGGGIVLCASDPNDASSNLVLVIGVKTVIPTVPTGRVDNYELLSRLQLTGISYQNLAMDEVLRDLRSQSVRLDPKHKGINFSYNPNVPAQANNPAESAPKMLADSDIHISLKLNNITMAQALDGICVVADHPIKFTVDDYGVVFSPRRPGSQQYEMRAFKVNLNTFYSRLNETVNYSNILENALRGGPAPTTTSLAKIFFQSLGVNLDPPKTLFFNDRQGVLFVYATLKDLVVIERVLETMNAGTVPAAGGINNNSGAAVLEGQKGTDAPANFVINPTNVWDPQQDDEDRYSKQRADDDFLRTFRTNTVVENDLEMRTFRLNTNVFLVNLRTLDKPQGSVSRVLEEVFSEAGVDLSPPKTLFYNDGMGVLFVQAPRQDMDVIERVIQILNETPPQIHIKARFIEMPSNWDDTHTPDLLSAIERSNSGYGILTASEMKAAWQQLQSQNGADELAEPEATTISGRHMQMRATGTQPVVAGDTMTPISNAEFGPILDVSPFVFADGHTISLTASAELVHITSPATKINSAFVPVALLYDGQTLVLFPKEQQPLPELTDEKSRERAAEHIRQVEKQNGNKTLIVFVTATLIDSVGNRLHSDDQMSFAQNSIPPQPQISDIVVP